MKSKNITILCFIATIIIALLGAILVYFLTVNNPALDRSSRKDIITQNATVDNIDGSSIVLSLKKDKDIIKDTNDDSKEKLALQVEDKDDLDGISVGDSVVVRYKDNKLISIKKADQDSDDKITVRIDKIEGDQVTVTPGDGDQDNFKETGETKTYTIEDTDDLKKIKKGDIVRIEIEDNRITDISSSRKSPNKDYKDSKDSSHNQNPDSQSLKTEDINFSTNV